MNRNQILDRQNAMKGFVRKMEGLVELVILSLAYYYVWKFLYRGAGFPFNYYGFP